MRSTVEAVSRSGRKQVQALYDQTVAALDEGRVLHDRGAFDAAVERLDAAMEGLTALGQAAQLALTGAGLVTADLKHMAGSLTRDGAEQLLGLVYEGATAARTLLVSSHRSMGRASEAIAVLEADVDLRQSVGDRMGAGRSRYALADLCAETGRMDQAETHYTALLEMSRQDGRQDDESVILGDLASVARNQGRFQEAVDMATQALDIRREMGDPAGVGAALTQLAGTLRVLGQNEATRRHLDEALEIARGIGHAEGVRVVLNSLGDLAFDEGRHEDALGYLEEALPLAREAEAVHDQALLLANMATTLRLMGRLPPAEEVAREALTAAHRSGEPAMVLSATVSLGQVRRDQGALEEATTHLEDALDLGRRLGLAGDEAEALLDLAEVSRAAGRLPEAADRYRGAVGAVERMRAGLRADELRTGYFARKTDPYRRLISLLVEVGEVEEALEVSERSRARAFLDLLAAAGQTGEPEVWGVERIRAGLLDEGTALLEYVVTEEPGVLFVLTDRDLAAFPLPPGGEIGELVRRMRQGILALEDAEGLPGDELYAALLDRQAGGIRAADLIAGKRLLVVADGPLHHLPFEVLRPEPGVYLVERHDVVYAPSASAVGLVATHTPEGGWPQDLVAFADPLLDGPATGRSVLLEAAVDRVRDGAALGSLPATREEVVRIAELLEPDPHLRAVADRAEDRHDGRRVTVAAGRRATKEDVVARFAPGEAIPSRFVHLSTHGLLDEAHPELSGLVFTAGPSGSPFWQTFEIMGARVAADLVVLSACQTGLGRLVGGEGVVGLSRAFLHAGARSLCVSLWQVPDVPTAAFMETFYRALLSPAPDKAAALREAKVRALAAGGPDAHPFFWAPFVLVGAWGWTEPAGLPTIGP